MLSSARDLAPKQAQFCITDLYEKGGALKPAHEWPLLFKRGVVAGVNVDELNLDGATVGSVFTIKLADRTKIKELLGKPVTGTAFKETINHNHKGVVGTITRRIVDASSRT